MVKNSLKIPFLSAVAVDAVPEALERLGEPFEVSNVNWKEEFPYAPLCRGRIARTDEAFLIGWEVSGIGVTVRNLEDGGPIWEDSCCEFFFKDPAWPHYFNIEVNAGGYLLVGKGTCRTDRVLLPKEEMARIVRIGGVPAPVERSEGRCDWRMTLILPFDLFGLDASALPPVLQGNIYKCGDKTARPHFLSWAPIDTPAPDFHCPRFFGDFLLV